MGKFRIFLWISWVWSLIGTVSAQGLQLPTGSQIVLEVQQGQTLRHRETMVFALPRPARAYSLDIAREMDGQKDWHARFGYPRVGFSAWMQDFGNRAVLGRSWSIHPFIDFNLWRIQAFRLRMRVAYGLTWIDQIHHPDTNPENNAIGSHLNNVTSLGLLAEYLFAQRLILRAGATLSHNSNGLYRVPNLGLNTTKIRVGLGYMIRPASRLQAKRSVKPALPKRLIGQVRFGVSVKEDQTALGPRYPVYILALGVMRWTGPKGRVFGGYEFSHDHSITAFIRNQQIDNDQFKPHRHVGYLGYEFIVGHVGMLGQVFAYLDPPFSGSNPWGTKIGPNYYLFNPIEHPTRNMYLGIYLKTHKAIADYAELTLGMTF